MTRGEARDDSCSPYPPAALQALGRKVCAPTSGTTTTTTVASTPEQQFASDATAQIQTVSSAVASGTLTTSGLGSYGDSICNLMPQYLNTYGPGPSAFNQIANEFLTDSPAFASLVPMMEPSCPWPSMTFARRTRPTSLTALRDNRLRQPCVAGLFPDPSNFFPQAPGILGPAIQSARD